jgi:putative transposase
MAEYQNSAHAKYDIKYHIVWITKYRYKMLTHEVGSRLRMMLLQGCQSRGLTIVSGHIRVDHVHYAIVMSSKSICGKIVQYLKG